jgi:DNA repair photolyase
VTDCYQPAEREFRITRQCLEVLLDFRNPCGVISKNHLVTRDIDLLQQLAAFDCVQVFLSITTLDAGLTQLMEPRTSVPRDRLRAIRELTAAGIPVGVMVAPVIPALTDHEMPRILEAARQAGATSAGFVPLRLPFVVKDLFTEWLERHFPDRKNKVLNRIRDLRGGKLNDPNHGSRMRGEGVWANQIAQTFKLHIARLGFNNEDRKRSIAHFRVPPRPLAQGDQLALFEG